MATNYGPRIVTDGLALCLDAGDALSYPGSGATWTDLSGNGNDGTLTNGPTYSNVNGGSIVFDRTDDYISSFPSPISVMGSRTVSCFFRTNTTVRTGLISTRTAVDAKGWVLTVNRNTAGNLTYFHTGGSALEVPAGISTNIWYNAVVSYNEATATVVLYLNGVQIGNPLTSFSAISPSSFNGTIGAEDQNFNTKFGGNISVVQVYNRALSAAEVAQNFNALRGRFGI